VTEQLICRDCTRAAEFQYAGSIGPLDLAPPSLAIVRRTGDALACECNLLGQFGVDFVVDTEGAPWLVDVNPRYTASMEIIERITGRSMIATHWAACNGELPVDSQPPIDGRYYGKAYLFACEEVTIGNLTGCCLADVPPEGTKIAKHAPVATVFADAYRPAEVESLLQQRLLQLEQKVYCSQEYR
ncbi:MAG: ATP-grasp domain-containing protein, partial [Aeoliella sp.]